MRILVPSSTLTAVVRQLLPAKQWLIETRRVSTVKCENSCPVEYSDGCCKTIAACETVVDRNSTGSLLSICNVMNKGNNKITELRTILQRESQNS